MGHCILETVVWLSLTAAVVLTIGTDSNSIIFILCPSLERPNDMQSLR
jgi:hypothetical protein